MRRRKHRPAADITATPGPRPPARPIRPEGTADAAGDRRPRSPAAGGGLWLWGRHAVLAALANPRRRLDRLVAVAEQVGSLDAALRTLSGPLARPPIESLDRRALAALLPADAVHQGVAALARPLPPVGLDDLPALRGSGGSPGAADELLLVVLDQVTDPRNIGAVLRSAHAFGAAAVVVQDRHAPEESGALAKAASGALEAVPLIRVTNIARTLRVLRDQGVRCLGLAGEAPEALDQQITPGALALVLGAEGEGLRRLVRESCDALVRIPIAPGVDSLNLSAAAAVALYACARQRVGQAGSDGG